MDIVDDGGKIVGVFRFHHHGVVPARKQVAPHAVARVETLGVGSLEPFHAVHQVRARGLEENVVVVGHQGIGVHGPAASAGRLLESAQKGFPVFVVQVNGVSAVALALHVIDRSRVFYSQGTAHAGSVPDEVKNASLLLFLT